MSFTKEELEAASRTYSEWMGGPIHGVWSIDGLHRTQELILRLALAHPERAELALGEGWQPVPRGVEFGFICASDGSDLLAAWHVEVDQDGHVFVSSDPFLPIPPEFDAALARARRIAAAWQRIQAKDGGK